MRSTRKWRIASDEDIAAGRTTDVYFQRTVETLLAEGVDPLVHAEVTLAGMPSEYDWFVVAGIDDSLKLLEDHSLDVWGLPEGTLMRPRDHYGTPVPVLSIEGRYTQFAQLETPILGFICFTSGLVTRTAHLRLAAGNRALLSFGARRSHPAVSPQIEYAAYIGGCDGVSSVLGAEMLGIRPSGTMPHSLIIAFQDHVKAWQAFDKHLQGNLPRIALTDTYLDEVREAIMAAQSVANLAGVRLDTTGSRRGDFKKIIQEVRWELDVRGFKQTKIYVSGGLDRQTLTQLADAPVDGYGVGGAISNAPSIDFGMDIVSIQKDGVWTPCAKRGKFSGRKKVWICTACSTPLVTLLENPAPACHICHEKMKPATIALIGSGALRSKPCEPKELREMIMKQLTMVNASGTNGK